MSRVYIAEASHEYYELFLERGWKVIVDPLESDLVVFTGGSDVSPDLYKEDKHPKTFTNPARDITEKKLFELCIAKSIPMFGICRGGQFLNVMSGGTLYQHVTNHLGDHDIYEAWSTKPINASSTHHQMMRPSSKGLLIAFASKGGIREYMRDKAIQTNVIPVGKSVDAEIVYYEHTNCLCCQPHPEFPGNRYDALRDLVFASIYKHIQM